MSIERQQFETIDRSQELRDMLEEYPEEVQRIASLYSEHKATAVVEYGSDKIVLENSVKAMDLAAEFARLARDEMALKALLLVSGINQAQLAKDFDLRPCDAPSGFRGMAANKYAGEILGETKSLQLGLEKQIKEVEKSGLKEFLEENLVGLRKRRKRFFSEYDGDFDLDRRWDSTPFRGTKSSKKEFPFIEVIFPISVNGAMAADSIARLNARCLALCDLIERAGYRVSIVAEDWTYGLLTDCGKTAKRLFQASSGRAVKASISSFETSMITRYVLRDGNDYGDMRSFSCFAGVEFLRRIQFALTTNPAHYIFGINESLLKHVSDGYGKALRDRPLPTKPGQIILHKDTVNGLFTSSEEQKLAVFQEYILNTIDAKSAAAMAS